MKIKKRDAKLNVLGIVPVGLDSLVQERVPLHKVSLEGLRVDVGGKSSTGLLPWGSEVRLGLQVNVHLPKRFSQIRIFFSFKVVPKSSLYSESSGAMCVRSERNNTSVEQLNTERKAVCVSSVGG